jgi:hypothetical protein
MAKYTPHNLQLQISRMFQDGQSLISFTKRPAAPGSREVQIVDINLKRKDGQPVAGWLLEQLSGG